MKKWVTATLAGAVTIFVWGGISHMVLLKGIGFTRMSNEERIVSTLRSSLPGDGLYFFPSIDLRGKPSPEETAAWEARFRAGPTGVLVIDRDQDLCRPLEERIVRAGMTVKFARDGKSGLRSALSGEHDLVVVDISSWEVPGLQAIKQLRTDSETAIKAAANCSPSACTSIPQSWRCRAGRRLAWLAYVSPQR